MNEQTQQDIDAIINEILDRNYVKYPSFYATYGRKPVAGQDYAPDATFCQDDYEYYTGTGGYSDKPTHFSPEFIEKLRKNNIIK